MSDITVEIGIVVSRQVNGEPKITLMGEQHDIPLSVAQAKLLVKILETTILACDVAYREANPDEKRTAYDEGRRITTPLRASSLGDFRPGEYQTTSLGQPTPTPQSQTS